MKYIVVGIGSFGAYLAIRLAEMGHEVVAVDDKMEKIDLIKDKVTHAVNMNATDLSAVRTLPFRDVDVVIIGIGEDFGASIMSTALFKQLQVKRLKSTRRDHPSNENSQRRHPGAVWGHKRHSGNDEPAGLVGFVFLEV